MTIETDNANKLSYKDKFDKAIFLFREKTRLNKEKLNLLKKVKSKIIALSGGVK